MTPDLTCKPCEGTGYFVCKWPGCEQRHPSKRCSQCGGRGRRPPTLGEWDALKAERDRAKEAVRNIDKALRNAVKERGDALDERDRYREALVTIAGLRQEADEWEHPNFDWRMLARKQERVARAALDSDPDLAERLAERTRRIRADE